MKIKRVKISIKDLKTGLQEFVQTAKAIQQGKKVKKEEGVYFTSFEAFRAEKKKSEKEISPTIDYDKILLEIAV